VAMLERSYAHAIADYSETMVRQAQIEIVPSATSEVVVPLASRRP